MIDPLISLAFSIQSNKGVYALLLGSGVSRSAQVPTGWEVVLDLIRKLAEIENEDCEPDPAAWYKKNLGKDPDYSNLLGSIVKSPAERNQLLRGYFEPSEEERDEGLKLPTAAHKAIAKLVSRGYVRVIVTTNFDRLLENALKDEGIEPTVISTSDAVKGALPLVHTKCTLLKVNGDYLDTRIRNTHDELASYDEETDRLLDQIFDEFGLIVCGWSGDWDKALRAAMERCKNHRFTIYWTDIRELTDSVNDLIKLRRGEFICIQNADTFFGEMTDNIFALENYSAPRHPLSAPVLMARVKKYLRDDRYDIRLHDLVNQEVEKLYNELSENETFPVSGIPKDKLEDEFRRQVQLYESFTEPALSMMITGCRWGDKSHEDLWVHCLERIANPPEVKHEHDHHLNNLRRYPALLLLYGSGMSLIAAGNYELFSALLNKPRIRTTFRDEIPATYFETSNVIEETFQKLLPNMKSQPTPLSNHLYEILRDPLRDILPQETRYQECFDRFEYLFTLVYVNLYKEKHGDIWAPEGCFSWRNLPRDPKRTIMKIIQLEIEQEDSAWPPLKAGLFGGDIDRFKKVKQEYDNFLGRVTSV